MISITLGNDTLNFTVKLAGSPFVNSGDVFFEVVDELSEDSEEVITK
jgi:hypothetical protein